jgi:hypothetical protein
VAPAAGREGERERERERWREGERERGREGERERDPRGKLSSRINQTRRHTHTSTHTHTHSDPWQEGCAHLRCGAREVP